MRWIVLLAMVGCGGKNSGAEDSGVTTDTTPSTATNMTSTDTTDGTTTANTTGTTGTNSTGAYGPIAEWTDSPGACPAGMPRQDLSTSAELADASRGEGAYANDPGATCYFIRDGVYEDSGNVLMWIRAGGDVGDPRIFVGESRTGVVIHQRVSFDSGANNVRIENLSFDLTGYVKSGSYNTITVAGVSNITLTHLTLTGDCLTGTTGGHVEVTDSENVTVEACLIERFGNCADGHLDHGIYLASGSNINIVNNEIRENASRGIQLYTAAGQFGALDQVRIAGNYIHHNGHADYEDGIVINGEDTGTITNITIERNLIARNYYSGIRFSNSAFSSISVTRNTFEGNGEGSTASNRSELNLDTDSSGGETVVQGNVFVPGSQLLNTCGSAASRGLDIADNVVFGGASGDCISAVIDLDPQLRDAAAGDLHADNPAAQGYGAY